MAASTEMSSEPRAFGSPFDDEDADLIIRSSDNVDFRVYKAILSKASPVFRTTLSLPQPATRDTRASREPCPVIDLAEGSKIIAPLLTSIHPVVFATTSRGADDEEWSLDDLIAILAAAKKYDMASASERVLQSFADAAFLRDKPIEAFCAAHKYKLEAPARIAAKACLQVRLNLDIVGEKLPFLDGQALHHLWRFHRACSAAATAAFRNDSLELPTVDPDDWWRTATSTESCPCRKHSFTVIFKPRTRPRSSFGAVEENHFVAKRVTIDTRLNGLWLNYMKRALAALGEQPSTNALLRPDVLVISHQETCGRCRDMVLG
ncbi:hypothetical protein BC834DRAFT_353248 [Gloeopeniophorella convolvens]|nr:hypothetical protein BC834DRAFT_353248 [Gloeopeniophorella convolvens]